MAKNGVSEITKPSGIRMSFGILVSLWGVYSFVKGVYWRFLASPQALALAFDSNNFERRVGAWESATLIGLMALAWGYWMLTTDSSETAATRRRGVVVVCLLGVLALAYIYMQTAMNLPVDIDA